MGVSLGSGRTIFIGDVHGCVAELRSMIQILDLHSNDRVIMLGDLINRGPDSPGVVEFVYKNKFECIKGNHEQEYLEHHTDYPGFKKIRQGLSDTLHRWIENLPLWIEDENFLAVHAGLYPDLHPSKTPEHILLNIRTVDTSEPMQTANLNSPVNKAWHEYYRGTKAVFYGHWARQGLRVAPPTYGLDSGCVYGKQLSAFVLEKKELVQIQAEQVYYRKPTDSKPEK